MMKWPAGGNTPTDLRYVVQAGVEKEGEGEPLCARHNDIGTELIGGGCGLTCT